MTPGTWKPLFRLIRLSTICSSFDLNSHINTKYVTVHQDFLCLLSSPVLWTFHPLLWALKITRISLDHPAGQGPFAKPHREAPASRQAERIGIFTRVLTYFWFQKLEHLDSTLGISKVYGFPWADTVKTKEALQGNLKKTLSLLVMPAIVISSVNENGTCLGTNCAILASGRANIYCRSAGAGDKGRVHSHTGWGVAGRLEGRLSTAGSQITHWESFD